MCCLSIILKKIVDVKGSCCSKTFFLLKEKCKMVKNKAWTESDYSGTAWVT